MGIHLGRLYRRTSTLDRLSNTRNPRCDIGHSGSSHKDVSVHPNHHHCNLQSAGKTLHQICVLKAQTSYQYCVRSGFHIHFWVLSFARLALEHQAQLFDHIPSRDQWPNWEDQPDFGGILANVHQLSTRWLGGPLTHCRVCIQQCSPLCYSSIPVLCNYGYNPHNVTLNLNVAVPDPTAHDFVQPLSHLHKYCKEQITIAQAQYQVPANHHCCAIPEEMVEGSKVWLNAKNIKTKCTIEESQP